MIYFAQFPTGGIKIGFSDNPPQRIKQLEAHYGVPLSVLAVLPGDRAMEAEWHERFASARLGRTEQFQPVPELMAAIGCPLLVGANPEAIEVVPPCRSHENVIRLSPEAVRWARIASGYTGESMAEYVSRLVAEGAKRDAERLHAEATSEQTPPKRKGPDR